MKNRFGLLIAAAISMACFSLPTVADVESVTPAGFYQIEVTPQTLGDMDVIAVATAENGFTLAVEYSACASPENFDAAIGEKIALQNACEAARKKLWELEGYALKKSL